jgi:hypothetical protein
MTSWRRLPAHHPQRHRDQRQRELALRRLRPGGEEVAYPGKQGTPFGLIHGEQMGVRADGGDQGVGGPRLPVLELAFLGRIEQVRGRLASRSGRPRPAPSRHRSRVGLDLRLLIADSSATQPTRSSSTFHSPTRTPPGASTRAISGSARSRSNQCMAWPARTTSLLASASGSRSALPRAERTSGSARRSSASISGSGSTAVTSAPRRTSMAVSFPVPAPMSATRSGRRSRTGSSAHSAAVSA